MFNINCSLVISTYNWPQALTLCLKSVMSQTILPDEIVIADDGSKADTKLVIDQFKKIFPNKITHVWQPDEGFRLAEIRNKSVVVASGEYIIQIDGDLILEKHFIEDHLRFAKEKHLLQGSRVMLKDSISRKLFVQEVINVNLFSQGLKRRENSIRILPLSKYLLSRYRNRYPEYYARGCNMSFFRSDFLDVNGYDEDFKGWGHEDSDLTLRLLNAGIKKFYLKFSGIVFHLYHDESKRIHNNMNLNLMNKHLESNAIMCINGASKYIHANDIIILD